MLIKRGKKLEMNASLTEHWSLKVSLWMYKFFGLLRIVGLVQRWPRKLSLFLIQQVDECTSHFYNCVYASPANFYYRRSRECTATSHFPRVKQQFYFHGAETVTGQYAVPAVRSITEILARRRNIHKSSKWASCVEARINKEWTVPRFVMDLSNDI